MEIWTFCLLFVTLVFTVSQCQKAVITNCKDQTRFMCSNGVCYPKRYFCDGRAQCADRTDETICSRCRYYKSFNCSDGYHCIPYVFRCDYINDCPDRSDVQNCTYPV
ncbi:low-density lipoprotein receptor class A domain-containing protein 3-like [Physella acuta]|uniref:low-density lipoprotein receptor class A domain-containing protein 3-like n=1 Tax=Physella acuta TaxID=109671 RepID=UPI0027DAF8B0|nr:low-density lipoprotein receptor class A domain-containing protein 3-like [Physella acuta]